MFETSRSYLFHFDRAVVPMAKGDRSRTVLEIAFALSHEYSMEITALTIKEETREVTWSDKVSVITRAYRDGKDQNIKVIPKVRTARSIKHGIIEEANSRGYDFILMGTFRRSPLSASVFGSIADFVLKNASIPAVIFSINGSHFPYRRILVPLSETINTRPAVSFALHLKKALKSEIIFADLRSYDVRKTHGFQQLFDNLGQIVSSFGDNITVVRPNFSNNLNDEVEQLSRSVRPDLMIMGIRPNEKGKIRINSSLKSLVKGSRCDTAVIRR
ncbi:MAG TPA: universal stress protein [Thermoplasmataceae archaeon]|nr:universal stress protein [Thermoplasmatales archaeon AK]HLH85354.1 universal stress protein [Thermoplasmataceae archaeon]